MQVKITCSRDQAIRFTKKIRMEMVPHINPFLNNSCWVRPYQWIFWKFKGDPSDLNETWPRCWYQWERKLTMITWLVWVMVDQSLLHFMNLDSSDWKVNFGAILKSKSHLPKRLFYQLSWKPFKLMKNAFHFILYALFVLKTLKCLSWLLVMQQKQLD